MDRLLELLVLQGADSDATKKARDTQRDDLFCIRQDNGSIAALAIVRWAADREARSIRYLPFRSTRPYPPISVCRPAVRDWGYCYTLIQVLLSIPQSLTAGRQE
eukprot:COSAG06_NODE_1476_length_9335_cov_181.006063_5_plen_104_part_00